MLYDRRVTVILKKKQSEPNLGNCQRKKIACVFTLVADEKLQATWVIIRYTYCALLRARPMPKKITVPV